MQLKFKQPQISIELLRALEVFLIQETSSEMSPVRVRREVVSVMCFHLLCIAGSVTYQELQVLGVSCPPQDTCQRRNESSLHLKQSTTFDESAGTCKCNSTCARRATCCIDSPYMNTSVPNVEACIEINTLCNGLTGVRAINKCKPQWNRSLEVKELCEGDPLLIGNAFMLIPASNTVSGMVYLNFFCAVCNDDHLNAVPWNFLIAEQETPPDMPSLGHDGGHYLEYHNGSKQWGYWGVNSQNRTAFVPVNITVDTSWSSMVNPCRLDIIQECAPDWTNSKIKKKCESYMAAVQVIWKDSQSKYNERNFRNFHCAICNRVTDFVNISCIPLAEDFQLPYCIRSFDTTNLFGHNVRNRDCLKKTERFIEELGKCRPVVCPKGRRSCRN